MREITAIVVHCSDSPQGRGDDVETIRRWHTDPRPQGNGWSDIGYHAVILEDGTLQDGRPEARPGAHVRGHNEQSIGVCLVGQGTYTREQYDTLYEYLVAKCTEYPRAVVYGHHDLDDSKGCPLFNVATWLEARHDAIENEKVLPIE